MKIGKPVYESGTVEISKVPQTPKFDAEAAKEPEPSAKTSPVPQLGDTVIYHSGKGTNSPAIVTKVHGATCVNLLVLPDGYDPHRAASVMRVHPESKNDGWFSRGEA